MTVEVVRRICELVKSKPNISYLSLYKAKIGDEGCLALCEIFQDVGHLKYLNLYQNALGIKSMKGLAALLLRNRSIKELSLSGNWFKDEGLEVINLKEKEIEQEREKKRKSYFLII